MQVPKKGLSLWTLLSCIFSYFFLFLISFFVSVPRASAGITNEAAALCGVWPHCATRRLNYLAAEVCPLERGAAERRKGRRTRREHKGKTWGEGQNDNKSGTRKQNESSVAIDGKETDKWGTTSQHRLQSHYVTVRKYERVMAQRNLIILTHEHQRVKKKTFTLIKKKAVSNDSWSHSTRSPSQISGGWGKVEWWTPHIFLVHYILNWCPK